MAWNRNAALVLALALWDATVRTTFGVERIHVADKRVVSNLSILVVRQRVADGCQVIGFELRARINGECLSWLDWFFLFEGGRRGGGGTIFKTDSSEFISTLKTYPCVPVVPWFVSEPGRLINSICGFGSL